MRTVVLAMYADDSRNGGGWRVGQTLARGLRRIGVDARCVFAYGSEGPIGKEFPEGAHYLRLRNSRDVRGWVRFRSWLRQSRPQILHFVDPVLWMLVASTGVPTRRIRHVHGRVTTPNPALARNRLVWRLGSRQVERFIAITEGARRSLVGQHLAAGDSVSVVYNAIDFGHFQNRPDRNSARLLLGLPPDAHILGTVSRLFRDKALDDFVRVLALTGHSWHGLIVGDGAERRYVEHLAEVLGVADRLTFLGNLDDVRPAYSAMNAFLFTSLDEPFGLVLAEAMACRVPVFGLAGRGEYREPANPLILPTNASLLERRTRLAYSDAEDADLLRELADRIMRYGRDPRSMEGKIEQAWDHIRTRFDMPIQAAAVRDVYRVVLTGSPSGQQGER